MALTVEAKAPSFALTATGGQEAPLLSDPYRSVAQAYSALKPVIRASIGRCSPWT